MNHGREKRAAPPGWAERLLERYGPADSLEEVLGDLRELYTYWLETEGQGPALRRYIVNVLRLVRPFEKHRKNTDYSTPNYPAMLRSYLKIAFRNLLKNKGYSLINIGGLAVGMAVATLTGLWIRDELSFNQYHQNYDRIAQVMVNVTYNGEVGTQENTSPPFGNALRTLFGNDFKHVLMSSLPNRGIISSGEKKLMKTGYYFEPGVTDMLSLKMLRGNRAGLENKQSVLLSESVAKALFGHADPMDKRLKIDNRLDVIVQGVYEDLPQNSAFSDMSFIAPWELYVSSNDWIRQDDWRQNGFRTYVQLADHAEMGNSDMEKVSAKIRNVKLNAVEKEEARANPELFLFPMPQWHLYADFENGVSAGGRIQFVWLYGTVGMFVLLLACINFMNLATARSEKRAKEVGIRKAIGSLRSQLISQFLSESLLVVAIAFTVSLFLVQAVLPFFNAVADKKMAILWTNPWFWLAGLGFSLFTGVMAGSYPALYLSSFQPVKVLKGTFKAGRFAALPRQVLVVLQFTVSITLIIGVIIVFRQIQVGKDRPVGYHREGLVMVETPTGEIHEHIGAVREDLKKSGTVTEIAESLNPMTGVSFGTNSLDWDGTGPHSEVGFAKVYIAPEFGKTVGWQFIDGRDFTMEYASDSSGIVLNETAVKNMGLKKPVGTLVKESIFGKTTSYTVIGVIKDMLMESPYYPVSSSVYMIDKAKGNFVNIRINPAVSTRQALRTIETVFRKYNPATPFEYHFVDEEYAKKFAEEERISKLASGLAILAIFISCLGLFGMAAFMAEQRTKEIGVRKVLGASVMNVWSLLSGDFVRLILISFLLAAPTAYYGMYRWLQNYEYRTELSWWVFLFTGVGALAITLLTVSYQAIKAALANPVNSLRME